MPIFQSKKDILSTSPMSVSETKHASCSAKPKGSIYLLVKYFGIAQQHCSAKLKGSRPTSEQ